MKDYSITYNELCNDICQKRAMILLLTELRDTINENSNQYCLYDIYNEIKKLAIDEIQPYLMEKIETAGDARLFQAPDILLSKVYENWLIKFIEGTVGFDPADNLKLGGDIAMSLLEKISSHATEIETKAYINVVVNIWLQGVINKEDKAEIEEQLKFYSVDIGSLKKGLKKS